MPEPSSLQQPETKLIRVPNMKTKTSNFRKRLGAKIQQMVKKKTGAKTRSDKEANHNQREVCEADLETREGARARSTVHVEENEGYCKVCANLSQDVPNLHFPTLKTSAEDGCPCCSTLLRIFEHFVYDGHRLIDAAADQYIDTKSYYSNGHRYAVDIVISSLNALIGLSIAPDVPNPYSLPVESGRTLVSSDRSPEEEDTKRHVVPLNANVSFDALSIATSLPRIQGWLQRCLSDHPKCNSYSTAFLPSRILAIGGPESAKIFLIPSKKQAPYIALSYCWGKAQFLKLTTKNLQTCKDGILIDTLPNSFRHAIEVARGLNIHNIWIDALCILQDDLGDWEIEASKMAEVYRNSVLVLAMTKASSPDEDCRGKILNTEIDSINARLIHHFPDPGYETSSAFPLAQRGWAFQERLLAPRVLHFGPHELAWQCLTSTDCECGREGGLLPSNHAFNEAILKQSDTENIASLWRTLVAQYSALQFTFESDRLPALSGIVAVIQSARPGLYLAGLWSDTLIIDMLWYVDDDLREDPLPSPTPTTSPLSSPSWSWASVGAPVLYSVSNSSFYEMTLQCHIEGFHCEPAGVSMTGRIKSGWVRMNSSMIKCHRSTSSGNTPRVTHAGGRSPQGPKDAELEATFLLDKLPDNQKLDFFMVRMATWESSHYTEEQTLLIRPVDELESCFERIGIAIRGVSQPPLPWPQERRTITIV